MHLILEEQIHVAEDRIRKEFDEAAIDELAASIVSKGLMNPVTVRKQGSDIFLVAGERRLRTIRKLHEAKARFFCNGTPVPPNHIPCLYLSELSPMMALEAELEENVCRRDLTWQESATARKKLFDLRRVQAESEGKTYTLSDLSVELEKAGSGRAQTRSLREEMAVAQFLDKPEVREAKTLKEAMGAAKKASERFLLEALGEAVTDAQIKTEHSLIVGDCLVEMAKLPAGRFSVICTDPPYGINIQDSGSMVTHDHHYQDGPDVLAKILRFAPAEFARITTPQAHLYWFCDFRWFDRICAAVTAAGFEPYPFPIIWWKRGKAMAPDIVRWPKREYECVVFASKGDKPTLKVAGDVIATSYGSDLQQAEKPKDLYVELLSRSAMTGDHIIDPFCGSGVIFTAADELKLSATGIELDAARADLARIRAFGL